MAAVNVGRNDPCPCGSGKKYKQCCAQKEERMSPVSKVAIGGVVVAIAAALAYSFTAESSSGGRQVWDPDHGHYHTLP